MVESEKSLQKFQTQLSDTYAESVTRVEHQNVLNKLRDSERQVVSYFRYLYQTLSKFTLGQVKSSKILTSSLVKICEFSGFCFWLITTTRMWNTKTREHKEGVRGVRSHFLLYLIVWLLGGFLSKTPVMEISITLHTMLIRFLKNFLPKMFLHFSSSPNSFLLLTLSWIF